MSLEEYTRYPVDKIVFSHSANSDVLEAGTMENVRFTIQYVKDIQDAVLTELQKGTNPFTLWKAVKLPQYSNLAQYDNWFELNVLAVTISNVLGPLSWSPKSSSSSVANTRSSSSTGQAPGLPTYYPNPNNYVGFNSQPSKSSNNNSWKSNSNSGNSNPWKSSNTNSWKSSNTNSWRTSSDSNPWKSSNSNTWKSSSDNNPWKSNDSPWNSVAQHYSKYHNF